MKNQVSYYQPINQAPEYSNNKIRYSPPTINNFNKGSSFNDDDWAKGGNNVYREN